MRTSSGLASHLSMECLLRRMTIPAKIGWRIQPGQTGSRALLNPAPPPENMAYRKNRIFLAACFSPVFPDNAAANRHHATRASRTRRCAENDVSSAAISFPGNGQSRTIPAHRGKQPPVPILRLRRIPIRSRYFV
jgi:hypothetical protein